MGMLSRGASGFYGCARRAARGFSSSESGGALALSFGGSGLMMLYQLGAADVLAADARFMARVSIVHGTSGGALVGALLLAGPPGALERAAAHYTSGAVLRGLSLRDLAEPHLDLLSRTVQALDLLPAGTASALRGRFVPHATELAGPRLEGNPLRNVRRRVRRERRPPRAAASFGRPFGVAQSVDGQVSVEFDDEAELLVALSASCCMSPFGVSHRGRKLFDGGLSDPLPLDAALQTVQVSIFTGDGVDIAPGGVERPAAGATHHGLRRYDASLPNLVALAETTVLTRKRARWRYDQGRLDAAAFLARLTAGTSHRGGEA